MVCSRIPFYPALMATALYTHPGVPDHRLQAVLPARGGGELVSALAGGYDLMEPAESAVARVRALQGE
jgi:hypothetical protein